MSEKPEKIYYGAKNPIPKGYTRQCTMKEAAEAGKVSYFGIKKIDSKLASIATAKKSKKGKDNIDDLRLEFEIGRAHV